MSAFDQCQRFLSAIFEPGDVIEFRPLAPAQKKWGTLSDLQQIVSWLTRLNAAGKHCYFGGNPRKADGGSKIEDVALARCLWADFDGGTTGDEAVARITSAGLPKPTVIVASGGGVHAWWRLSEPMADLDEWTRCMRALIAAVGSDKAVHDAPRIMRLPGFVNHKYENKPVAEILDVDPSRVYPLTAMQPRSMSRTSREFLDCGTLLPGGGRRETIFTVACDLQARGWTEWEAENAIMARAQCLGLTAEDVNDLPRQIRNAFGKARTPIGSAVAQWVGPGEQTVTPELVEEWEPFPVDVLPEPLRSFVTETTEIMSADPALVAVPLLAAVAGAVGNRRAIEVRPGWIEPAVLWSAVVAESGSMKSPCADKALAFVREQQQFAFEAHRDAMRQWEIEKREHERASRRRDADAGDPPDKPVAERLIVDDTTLEALGQTLADNPVGVLLARDELSGWVEGFDKYNGGKGGEVTRWLSLYNAGPLTFDRKLSGTTFVSRAAVSITGTIQPRVLARVAGSRHVDNGLLPRFLLAMPPRRPKVWTTGDVNFATVAAMRTVFTTISAARPADDGGPKVLTIDADATDVFKNFYQEHAAAQLEAAGAVAAMMSKAEAWAARLALVLHVARQAGDAPTLGDRLTVASIEAGITLARWFAREWRRVFAVLEFGGDVGPVPADAAALAFARSRGGTVTVRDMARLGPPALRAPGAAELAVRRLVAARRAEWLTLQTGGRPADAIRVTG
jgi:hypothetical protein